MCSAPQAHITLRPNLPFPMSVALEYKYCSFSMAIERRDEIRIRFLVKHQLTVRITAVLPSWANGMQSSHSSDCYTFPLIQSFNEQRKQQHGWLKCARNKWRIETQIHCQFWCDSSCNVVLQLVAGVDRLCALVSLTLQSKVIELFCERQN